MNIKEICIEITSKCNLKCNGCFNAFSSDHIHRNTSLNINQVSNIFEQANHLDIPLIRITGGEPTQHSNIEEILKLKSTYNSIHLRLNTNALDIAPILQNLDLIDSFHISLNGYNNEQDSNWTNTTKSFEMKINSIKQLQERNKIIRIGTILTDHNIKNLNQFFPLIEKLDIDHWEFYRPISNRSENYFEQNLEDICLKLAYYSFHLKQKVQIANAIPFCVLSDKSILNEICVGAEYDDGNSRLIVSPNYKIKPSYYLDIELDQGNNLNKAIHSNYRQKLLKYDFLPSQCQKCIYLNKCKGGSRYKVFSQRKKLYGRDPLMRFP